jgi:hypothetical protein
MRTGCSELRCACSRRVEGDREDVTAGRFARARSRRHLPSNRKRLHQPRQRDFNRLPVRADVDDKPKRQAGGASSTRARTTRSSPLDVSCSLAARSYAIARNAGLYTLPIAVTGTDGRMSMRFGNAGRSGMRSCASWRPLPTALFPRRDTRCLGAMRCRHAERPAVRVSPRSQAVERALDDFYGFNAPIATQQREIWKWKQEIVGVLGPSHRFRSLRAWRLVFGP